MANLDLQGPVRHLGQKALQVTGLRREGADVDGGDVPAEIVGPAERGYNTAALVRGAGAGQDALPPC